MLALAINATSAAHSIVRMIREPRGFIPALVIAWLFSGRLRAKWKQKSRERQVDNWPTITATIEVSAVINQGIGEKSALYMAELTYFYRNPELQMGEGRT